MSLARSSRTFIARGSSASPLFHHQRHCLFAVAAPNTFIPKTTTTFSQQQRSYAKKKRRGSGVIEFNPKVFTSPIFLKKVMRQWLASRKRNIPRRRRRIKAQLEEIALKHCADQIFDTDLQEWLRHEAERRQMRLEALEAIDCPNLKMEARRRTTHLNKNAAFSKLPSDLPHIQKWKSSFLQYHLKELEEVHEKKQKQRELLSSK
mmetsp:Transcript_8855/g.32691  ORF Transcript_8855/g.32691 Transcript_8855/m.32691 type:complete len:205 (+) Transcript_8855:3-617(+)